MFSSASMSNLLLIIGLTLTNLVLVISASDRGKASEQVHHNTLARKSIVFDVKTPKVFYCPQEKPSDMDKMIVKAQPLDKLCEFEGKTRPKHMQSDCYNDVDETEFACDEKRRFMIRLDLAGEGLDLGGAEAIDDLDHILAKNAAINKKKLSLKEKKKF